MGYLFFYAIIISKGDIMKLIVKTYDELTKEELYEIIKARLQIFVEEQKCLYQDLDGLDYKALHFFFMDNHVVA